jgi:hypothetical protein
MNSQKLTQLRVMLAECIDELDTEKVLSKQTKIDMTFSLTEFVRTSINKYIKGQKEHCGLLQNRDLDKEMKAEILDLFWYSEAKDWK